MREREEEKQYNRNKQMNERYKYIDLGAGIMILWMIIFHAWQAGLILAESQEVTSCGKELMTINNPMQAFPFLLFFMPWFFYKSGMLFRIRPAKELFMCDCKKLLRPFAIWSFAGYVIYIIMCFLDGTATLRKLTYSIIRGAFLTETIPINGALWFLVSLFAVRQICNVALDKVHPLIISFSGMLVAYLCHLIDLRLMPDWVPNIGIGLFFFSIGYWLNNNIQFSPKVKNIALWISLFIFCSWCIISLLLSENNIWRIPIVSVNKNTLIQGLYLLWYPTCLLGIFVFNQVTRKCESLSLPFLIFIGRDAMLIYVVHALPCQTLLWMAFIFCSNMNILILVGLIVISYGVLITIIKLIKDYERKNRHLLCNG